MTLKKKKVLFYYFLIEFYKGEMREMGILKSICSVRVFLLTRSLESLHFIEIV